MFAFLNTLWLGMRRREATISSSTDMGSIRNVFQIGELDGWFSLVHVCRWPVISWCSTWATGALTLLMAVGVAIQDQQEQTLQEQGREH
jgi:hypothetical protein